MTQCLERLRSWVWSEGIRTSTCGARGLVTCSCASAAVPPSPDTTMMRASGSAPRTGSTSPASVAAASQELVCKQKAADERPQVCRWSLGGRHCLGMGAAPRRVLLSTTEAARRASDEARVQDLEKHLAAVAQQVGALQEAVPVDDHRGDAPAQRRRAEQSETGEQRGMLALFPRPARRQVPGRGAHIWVRHQGRARRGAIRSCCPVRDPHMTPGGSDTGWHKVASRARTTVTLHMLPSTTWRPPVV